MEVLENNSNYYLSGTHHLGFLTNKFFAIWKESSSQAYIQVKSIYIGLEPCMDHNGQ